MAEADIPSSERKMMRIIIIGAGLSGLSAAIALREKGHEVTLFEASKALLTAGAGIQVPPISTRLLRSWGLEDNFTPKIVIPKTFAFYSYDSGKLLGAIPLNPFCEQRYGAPWWTIHRADFQQILHDVAVAKGAKVHLDCRVESVDSRAPSVSVLQHNTMQTYQADLIIAGDGLRSRTRAVVLEGRDVVLNSSNICAYRALVPTIAMLEADLRAPLMDPNKPNCDVWLGHDHAFLAYPIRQGEEAVYNAVLVHPEVDEHTTHEKPSRFPRPAHLPEISAHFANFCPQVRSVVSVLTPEDGMDHWISQLALGQTEGILEWKLADFDPLETWISESKKVVLVGDAAHAGKPHMSSGAALALEDAAALAEFLDPEVLGKLDLQTLLPAFEQIRKPRTSKVSLASAADAFTWSLKAGPERDRRDELLQYLGCEDRSVCANAMSKMKHEGVGEFNFGDASMMDWCWGYDVVKDAKEIIKNMLSEAGNR